MCIWINLPTELLLKWSERRIACGHYVQVHLKSQQKYALIVVKFELKQKFVRGKK
jgi:hypothetical protein